MHGNGNGDNRKVICLGMPSTGHMTHGASTGLHRASRRKDFHVNILTLASSLATQNHNRIWCWALNTKRRGKGDYVAVIHSDVEPPEYWLDVMVPELEANNLDVLGAIIAIKDNRGQTSTAIAHPSGDPWRIQNRITMTEAYRLPETFTSEDVGGPLLINTGLFVARLNLEWGPKVFFTVNDRIMIHPDGDYVAQCEPEDWFASRLYHELGLRVGCTRKLEVWHRGDTAYGNAFPWGTDEFDKQHATRSFLDDCPPADWFPHDAAGWLTEAEGRELARLAEGKNVLEIGAYLGRATICLAQTARTVGTIDTFDGRGTAQPGNTRPLFERNLRRHRVMEKVNVYQGESVEMLANLPPAFDLVFIDGSHDRASVWNDATAAAALLRPDGVLVFHDYGARDAGVTEAVNDLLATGGKLLGRCETLAVVRPPAAALLGV